MFKLRAYWDVALCSLVNMFPRCKHMFTSHLNKNLTFHRTLGFMLVSCYSSHLCERFLPTFCAERVSVSRGINSSSSCKLGKGVRRNPNESGSRRMI
jgi:hypothetical protein